MSERFTALPWAAWFAAVSLVVLASEEFVILAFASTAAFVSAPLVGGPRAALGRTISFISYFVATVWVVLGVAIHRPGLGGRVVWILPEWSTPSSGDFGGAVTMGQLEFAASRAVQAVAIVAMLGLLARAVPPESWREATRLVWGNCAAAWFPLVALGEARVEQQREHVLAQRSGFVAPTTAESATDLVARARVHAAGGAIAAGRVKVTADLFVCVAVCLWWSLGAITPGLPGDFLTGPERTLVALIVLALIGTMKGRRVARPTPADTAPLLGAILVATAWFGQDLAGEISVLLALSALPLMLLVGRPRS